VARKPPEKILGALDRPIAYHRVFVSLTGSVTAAVMLSQMVYWQKRATREDGWWHKGRDEWEEETGLTRREQETARAVLRDMGVLSEDLRGMPARLYFRIDAGRLEHLIAEGGCVVASWAESAQQDGRKTPNKMGGNEPTCRAESAQHVGRIPPTIRKETSSETSSETSAEKRTAPPFPPSAPPAGSRKPPRSLPDPLPVPEHDATELHERMAVHVNAACGLAGDAMVGRGDDYGWKQFTKRCGGDGDTDAAIALGCRIARLGQKNCYGVGNGLRLGYLLAKFSDLQSCVHQGADADAASAAEDDNASVIERLKARDRRPPA
jgi:hypothetical protein